MGGYKKMALLIWTIFFESLAIAFLSLAVIMLEILRRRSSLEKTEIFLRIPLMIKRHAKDKTFASVMITSDIKVISQGHSFLVEICTESADNYHVRYHIDLCSDIFDALTNRFVNEGGGRRTSEVEDKLIIMTGIGVKLTDIMNAIAEKGFIVESIVHSTVI